MWSIIFLSVVLAVAIFFAGGLLLHKYIQKKYETFVLKNSVCLEKLNNINSRYDFCTPENFDMSNKYDNENFYCDISPDDFLIYEMQFMSKNLHIQIDKANYNKQKYSEYVKEVKGSCKLGEYKSPVDKMNSKRLSKTEKKLAKNNLASPTTEYSLTITLYRTDINGKVFEKKSERFDSNDILTLEKRMNNRRGYFYNDRGIWDAICRVERGKVSNKMRFAIYRRDGNRCRNCGISGSRANLEIDHIIPIAKGGKSTMDNLQTLCHRCNVNKGADIW